MPVYNEENFLHECIASILSQRFRNWELIAVDDFSSDNSFDILGQYCLRDHRITAMKNKAKGIIPALATAFSCTKGLMITRMDADDLMPEDKLESMVSELKEVGPGNIISGKVKYFSSTELGDGYMKYENWINKQLYYEDIYKECTLPSACWMAYKKDLDRINAFEESVYPEDYDLLFKFYQSAINIIGLDKILHLWRDHPDRASRNDPNYQDQNYFSLKISYFLTCDYDENSHLVIWGAGRKGKALVKSLFAALKNSNTQRTPTIRWVTENEKKIGKNIYGITVEHLKVLKELTHKQVLVAISDQTFLKNKSDLYNQLDLRKNEIFEFCK